MGGWSFTISKVTSARKITLPKPCRRRRPNCSGSWQSGANRSARKCPPRTRIMTLPGQTNGNLDREDNHGFESLNMTGIYLIKRRQFLQTAAAGAVSALLSGNSAGADSSPAESNSNKPNVLLIMTDQHRADLMTCAGRDLVPTPNIDLIASRGRRFPNA